MNDSLLRRIPGLLAILCLGLVSATTSADPFDRALAGDHRDPANAARDGYRNPKATLEFFGLRPDMTVVEIWPGRGWYTEILAPVLREQGRLYAAGFVIDSEDTNDYRRQIQAAYLDKLAARPDVYDQVIVTAMGPPDHYDIAPEGSADLVLTFRNVHNWTKGGFAEPVFAAFHRALKPGGVLGIVEHRAAEGTSMDDMFASGYVTESLVIELAEAAGFRFDGRSEINANPRDTKDHPRGVWTLPPTLRLGDEDRDKYLAIGESDRMTLRFVKP